MLSYEQIRAYFPKTFIVLKQQGYNVDSKHIMLHCKRHDEEDKKKIKAIVNEIALELLDNNCKLLKTFNVFMTQENGKLEGLNSIAFNPYTTCTMEECFKKGTCYGLFNKYNNIFKMIESEINTLLAIYCKKDFIKKVDAYIKANPKKYFRWNENGDIANPDILDTINTIALKNKRVKFLVMTKKFWHVETYLKKGGTFNKNITLKLSDNSYNGVKIPETELLSQFSRTDIVKGGKLQKGFCLCPNAFKKTPCVDCKLCFDNTKNVGFEYHN